MQRKSHLVAAAAGDMYILALDHLRESIDLLLPRDDCRQWSCRFVNALIHLVMTLAEKKYLEAR